MKPRPKFRETVRTKNAIHVYDDKKRMRWVVYRRAGGIARKTSLRYASGGREWSKLQAAKLAVRLESCPADKLASFVF